MKAARTTLRVPGPLDLPTIQALWLDPPTMEAVGGPVELSDADAEIWFARMVDPGGEADRYRLVLDESGDVIGEVSFHRMNLETRSAGLNIKIVHGRRRQGYAREALAIFLREFFDEQGGREMTDDLALGNEGGLALMLAFGFEHDPSVEGVTMMRLSRERYREYVYRKKGTSA